MNEQKEKELYILILNALDKTCGKTASQLQYDLNYAVSLTTLRNCLQQLLHSGKARYNLYGARLKIWYRM